MDGTHWNQIIARLPGANILQTWEWGQLKQANGWQMLPQIWKDLDGKAAALILSRPVRIAGVTLPLSVMYVPRGPLLDWDQVPLRNTILDRLQELARKQAAIFVKIDPEIVLGTGVAGDAGANETETGKAVTAELELRGWRYSDEQIQFRNTVWIDLQKSEDELLANLRQKWRYNLRLAQRKGVAIRHGTPEDLPLLYGMYAETSVRDGFVIRPQEYYLRVWLEFMQRGMAEPLIAQVNGEAVSGLFLFHFAGRAWYLYGMSRPVHRELMPNHLLQWEAILLARNFGCRQYDLWGAPDVFDESDAMWGVYRFKEGMGGCVVRTLGAWDYPVRPNFYTLYTRVLPRVLDVMRRRGKERTYREVA